MDWDGMGEAAGEPRMVVHAGEIDADADASAVEVDLWRELSVVSVGKLVLACWLQV